MRRSLAEAVLGCAKSLRFATAATLTTTTFLFATSHVEFQDIADLTGVASKNSDRWAMRLVTIPTGSTVAKANARTDGVSVGVVRTRLAVRTGDDAQLIQIANTRTKPGIATKGDRVIASLVSHRDVGKTPSPLLQAHSILLQDGLNAKLDSIAARHMLAMAQRLHLAPRSDKVPSPSEVQIASLERPAPRSASGIVQTKTRVNGKSSKDTSPSVTLPTEVAKLQTTAPDFIAAEAAGISNETTGSVVTAYAAPEADVSSPFSAVLRPTLPKERPIFKGLKKALSKLKIKLGKNDHKWALNPLPKNSYSAAQRRCLAVGIYFEARGEPVKGQQAVAQVILNRVKNPAYPRTICGVVYQNKWKRNRCQFSFACDGIRDRIRSRKHWRVAKKVANDAIEGKVWLRQVGSASHYHADYVRPRWRRTMKRRVKIGRHIFYRTYGGGWT